MSELLSSQAGPRAPASIAIVGGGPAGSFFAIEALTMAKALGRELEVTIIEQKRQSLPAEGSFPEAHREGCNYCAGGISPRLADILHQRGLELPQTIIQSVVRSITIQANWKHIEIKVPPGRRMFSVYRGSRPQARSHREENLDSYLLEYALSCGARVVTGLVREIRRVSAGMLTVCYRPGGDHLRRDESLDAEFVVVAAGVNQRLGMPLDSSPLMRSLKQLLPGFEPPKVRRALICELQAAKEVMAEMAGELHFVEYGSKDLRIEMSSIVPKQDGLVTVALLGQSIDRAGAGDGKDIIEKFLRLPHVRRLLPPNASFQILCACFPSMTVGMAKNPFGDRVALLGDLVVSRLYKDGLLSTYVTALALASCVLREGGDAASLKRGYMPVVHSMNADNRFGRAVFFANRAGFAHPILSRVLYQAVITERKSKREGSRILEDLLWRIASGDDTYRNILLSMFSPASLKNILCGGMLVTARNYLTELLFGLQWGEVGRYPTGVYKEIVEERRRRYACGGFVASGENGFDFERMYSIKIKAAPEAVMEQLARFGEDNMGYFRPRIVTISKVHGSGNNPGKVIAYRTPVPFMGFSIRLERVQGSHLIVYRVRDGFARGGSLVFEVEPVGSHTSILSIYVAFNFPRGGGFPGGIFWRLFRHAFPQYVHDVLWNYSLCQLKDIAERRAP